MPQRGPDADEMRHILATFIEQHPMQEADDWDQTTQKEVSIVSGPLSRLVFEI
jgi:hypothetical protein